MNFKGHLISGATGATISSVGWAVYSEDIVEAVIIGLAVFLASLFPDSDTDSIPGRWFNRVGFITAGLLWYFGLKQQNPEFLQWGLFIGAIGFLTRSGKHRGWTHSWYLVTGFSMLGIFIHPGLNSGVCLALSIGI